MKFTMLLIVLSAGSCFASESPKVLGVEFKKDKQVQEFVIIKSEGKKQSFNLVFTENGRQKRKVSLDKGLANQLQSEATDLVWEAKYRRPASIKQCHEYLSVFVGSERSQVCYESQATTGKAYGFLSKLDGLMK